MRVVVTGLGAVSPLGRGARALWDGLLHGRLAFGPVRSFSVAGWRTSVGAELPEDAGLPRGAFEYALAAAQEALSDARLDAAALGPRLAVALGTTAGEETRLEDAMRAAALSGAPLPEEAIAPHAPGRIAARLARAVGARGPVVMLATACAAGNSALAWAYEKLASGQADAALAGGADVFSPVLFAGFNRLLAVAPDRCRPFSLGRQGLIPGEGAGVLVVETEASAKARGAHVYAEVLGYGLSSDAHHATMPHVDGVSRAIAGALAHGGLSAGDVDYVNAHGTGTPANDRTESAALSRVLGARATTVPVSSIKGNIGHAMGAATALEAVACCLALETGTLPPTASFAPGDPDCPLDSVGEGPRTTGPRVALSDGFAFGGANAVVAFAKPGARPERARPAPPRVVITAAALTDRVQTQPVAALLPDRDLGALDASIAAALCGVKAAFDAAKLETVAAEKRGVILDSTGEERSLFEFFGMLAREGPQGVEPGLFPNLLANAAPSRAAIVFGLKAVNIAIAGTFAGGESAVAAAWDLLRGGHDAAILAGGVSADGSASVFVLETLDAARARGVRPLAEAAALEESFEPEEGGASACGCLAKAVEKAAAGTAVEYRAKGRFGQRFRLSVRPIV
jgi:3-oxoacyl-[acyl-carrier-protein] synthase II